MSTKEDLTDRKALLERQAEIDREIEALQSQRQEKPQSFLDSLLTRARLGVSNPDGAVDYLQKQGRNATFEDGDLKVDGQNLDPSAFKTIVEGAFPPAAAVTAIQDLLSSDHRNEHLRRVQRDFNDLPNDIVEMPADILNMALTTAGGVGGTLLGAFGGPAAPVTVPAGAVAGSAAGGVASEKIKQAIGERLGVYKTTDEFLTPEAVNAGQIGAISGVIPGVIQGMKVPAKAISEAGIKAGVPQKMYASGVGLAKENVDNPEIVNQLLRDGVTGSKSQIYKKSTDEISAMAQQYRDLLRGRGVEFKDIQSRLKPVEDLVESGNVQEARQAMTKVLGDLKTKYFKNGAGDLADLNFEKSQLANAAKRVQKSPVPSGLPKAKVQKEVSDAIRNEVRDQVGKDVIDPLNYRYHAYDVLNDSVDDLIKKKSGKLFGVGLDDMALAGTSGFATGNPVVAVGSVAAKKALESTYAKTKGAAWLQKLLTKGSKLTPPKGMPKTEAAILAAIRQIVGSQDLQE